MARRKQEVQLQQDLETQEEWEEMLSKDGLYVVDIYQEWSGPCGGMVSNLRRLKNELGDDLLKFAVAKADTIDALEKYRGKCEPCFLFFATGSLVAVVRGANSPLILRTITEQLAQEHKVLDGSSERKEIKDPEIAALELREKAAQDEEEHEKEDEEGRPRKEAKKQVTVAIIKPDAVQAGKVDEIIDQMKESGLEILKQDERQLTEDEAREFYSHLQEEEFFEDLVKFMSSGPSCVCVLTKGKTGENVVEQWRDLIGPTTVEEAKEQAPSSWRAKYGSEKFMNALHGSSSEEQATRELAFFFPDYVVPTAGKPKLQRTLALIRPDAFRLHKDEILGKIKESGFKVAMQKEVSLSKEQAEDFYKEHKGQDYFENLVTRMSSGSLLALGLAREDAIQGWREMLGPKELEKAKEEAPESLRAQFAVDDVELNQLHGSDSEETARQELEYFFPMEQTVAVIKPDHACTSTKDEIIDKIHESGFRIAARKETTLTREMAEEFYADHKDKEYYNDLVDSMISGPTYFMVLSREDAVQGWRELIGPTDPDTAKEKDPESIRAMYGTSVLQNAVHGSSTSEQASKAIKHIFGDLQFTTDGTVEEGESAEGEERPQSSQKEEESKPETEKPASPTPQKTEEAEKAGETKPAEGESKPEEGESKPKEEESKPDEEEKKPAEGESKDEAKPAEAEGEAKPDDKKEDQPKTEEQKEEDKKEEEKKDDDKKEDVKAEDKKEDDKKEDEKAADDKKEDEKAADDKKEDEKAADDKKEDEKKEEEKKDDTAKPDEQKAEGGET